MVRSSLPVRTRLLAGSALLLMLVGIGALVSYRTAAAFFRINQAVRAGTQRLLDAREVFVALVDAETGQRGYLLTGRREFLEPYDSSVTRIRARLEHLRGEYRNDAVGFALADSLYHLARRRLLMLEQGLGIRRREGFRAGSDFVASGVGKMQMDSVRTVIARMERLEQRQLTRLAARADLLGERTRLAIGVLAALSLGLALATALLLARYLRDQAVALRRIEASEERFRSFMRHTPTVTFIKDDRGRYVYANRELARLFRREPADIEGRTDAELLPRALADRLTANDRRVLDTGQPEELLEVVSPHGEEREYLTLKFPIRDDSTTYIGGVAVDVTERRRVEERISQLNEELEHRVRELTELNADLDAFAYTVSHDLRAPLRAIQGFAEALQEDYGDRLDDTGRDYTRRLANAGRSMDQLIQDLLAYSRLRRTDVPLGPLDLAALVRRLVSGAQARGDLPAATLVQLPEQLPQVLAQRTVLEQVLLNLLANAAKFVRAGEAPRVTVRAEVRNASVRLWVEDQGIGVPHAQAERIFRPFERLHGSEAYPGTGIGLAIVRRGMERMGGTAGLEPSGADAGGSRFWIELPTAEDERGLA